MKSRHGQQVFLRGPVIGASLLLGLLLSQSGCATWSGTSDGGRPALEHRESVAPVKPSQQQQPLVRGQNPGAASAFGSPASDGLFAATHAHLRQLHRPRTRSSLRPPLRDLRLSRLNISRRLLTPRSIPVLRRDLPTSSVRSRSPDVTRTWKSTCAKPRPAASCSVWASTPTRA